MAENVLDDLSKITGMECTITETAETVFYLFANILDNSNPISPYRTLESVDKHLKKKNKRS